MKKILFISAFIMSACLMTCGAAASTVTGTFGTVSTGVETGVTGVIKVNPTASPVAGTYTTTQSVTLSAAGASSIRYTINGTEPTCASTAYSSAISVSSSTTIKARACYADGSYTSASFAYTISSGGGGGGGGGGSGLSPLNGVCGTANNQSYYSVPTVNLCSAGTASAVSGSGPWTWVCIGSNGGSSSLTCTAQKSSIPPVITSGGGGTAVFQFTQNLTLGSTGEEVRQLQIFLNTHGFPVAASGAGSPGNESTYFGPATQAALAAYQASVGISPASGYFGSITRAYINAILARSGTAPIPPITPPSTATTTPSVCPQLAGFQFTQNMTLGYRGEEARKLQIYLNCRGFMVSTNDGGRPGEETTYFGTETRAALAKYQASVSISPAIGYFGPKTRNYINPLLK